jgi:hypothetical protein
MITLRKFVFRPKLNVARVSQAGVSTPLGLFCREILGRHQNSIDNVHAATHAVSIHAHGGINLR